MNTMLKIMPVSVDASVPTKASSFSIFRGDSLVSLDLSTLTNVVSRKCKTLPWDPGFFVQSMKTQLKRKDNYDVASFYLARNRVLMSFTFWHYSGSEDIVKGNMKLILGMIWRLILRYQIGKAGKVRSTTLMFRFALFEIEKKLLQKK